MKKVLIFHFIQKLLILFGCLVNQPVSITFLSHQISTGHQPANITFLSQQISTNHQPLAAASRT
jgi:hypothetical protein